MIFIFQFEFTLVLPIIPSKQNGVDAARKVLILARECGAEIELSDVQIASLVPKHLESASVADFFTALPTLDAEWAEKCSDAAKRDERLAFVCSFDAKTNVCSVGPVSTNKFNALSGTDNVVSFTTRRYLSRPLTIMGSGAGADVTASGCLADIFRVVR